MTPRQFQYMAALKQIIVSGEVYTHHLMSALIGVSVSQVSDIMNALVRAGTLSATKTRKGHGNVYEISIRETGEKSAKIDGTKLHSVAPDDKRGPRLDLDEIIARRDAVEHDRERRRRQLLAQERAAFAGRGKAHDDAFWMDAATVRALSGGTMGGVRG